MATQADVRRIALALPDVREKPGHFAFEVPVRDKWKGFCWVWMERVDPKKARVPCPAVLAVRVADLDAKEALLLADDLKFFDEPHYAGFPAVLVRLEAIGRAELRALLLAARQTVGAPVRARLLAGKKLQRQQSKASAPRGKP
jgi:hypothetical protein